jgi:hypothetical protein
MSDKTLKAIAKREAAKRKPAKTKAEPKVEKPEA